MMCAGVQNVSLPIDMCHEMSHGPPIVPHTIPATIHQIVHGTDSTFTAPVSPARAAIGGLAICVPNGMDCPIAFNSSAATQQHSCSVAASLHPAVRPANRLPPCQPRYVFLRSIANHLRTNTLHHCKQLNRRASSRSLKFCSQVLAGKVPGTFIALLRTK
jgi:hypothetical protein